MIVYVDVLTGDEMLSSAFPLSPVVDEEGNEVPGLMKCESKMIAKSGDDVDIGCGNAFGGEAEDTGAAGVETVNNVIDGFQYNETTIGSAMDFKAWIKDYMQAVRTHMKNKGKPKEEIQAFMAMAPGIAKFFLKRFSDVQFYLGPSFNPESMVFSIYADGATTPDFYYIMPGFDANKF